MVGRDPGEVDDVADAKVHALRADRREDMRCLADKCHAVAGEGGRAR